VILPAQVYMTRVQNATCQAAKHRERPVASKLLALRIGDLDKALV